MANKPTVFIRQHPDGTYTVETDTGETLAGPFNTKPEADAALRATWEAKP